MNKKWIYVLMVALLILAIVMFINKYKRGTTIFNSNDWSAYNKCVEENKKLSVGSSCKSCGPNAAGDFNGTIDVNGRCAVK